MLEVLKHLKIALIISVIIFIVMTIISYFLGYAIALNSRFFTRFLYFIMYGLFFYTANALVMIFYQKKYGKEHYSKKRIIVSFLTSIVVSTVVIFILRVIEDVIIEGENFNTFLQNEKFNDYLVPFIIVLIVLLGFNIIFIYRALQDKKIKQCLKKKIF